MKDIKIVWHYDEIKSAGPASAEFGEFCLYASRVSDCPHGRWVWTADLIDADPEEPRPALHGIARTRTEAIEAATAAILAAASGSLVLV